MQNEFVTSPAEEASRQLLAMDRLKVSLAGLSMTYHITTLGCQMNAHDSEKLAGILRRIGFTEAEEEEKADLVVYNTCCIRENAELRVYGRLGYLKGYKKKNPGMKIALCGCMMQEPHVIEKLKQSYPWVDLIFGTHNLYRFAELLEEVYAGPGQVLEIWDKPGAIVEDLPMARRPGVKASVNIMFGCNNFCTYCIVPYVRGRERSRLPEEVVKEVTCLAEQGVKEIELLGQNVNSYGKDLPEPVSFAKLLYKVSEVPGIERIRFMSSHPKDLSDELIEAMGDCPGVCPHFHLPLQSGSTRLLARMNRRYSKEDYLLLVEKLRRKVPEIAISTDIIVGFPGETEEDFAETLDVVRKVQFDSAFTFIYSPRQGTPAATYPEQIPEEVSKERFDRLVKALAEGIDIRNERLVGRTVTVLAEEQNSRDPGLLTGRTGGNQLVHFAGTPDDLGQFVEVRITEQKTYYLLGEQVKQ